MVSYTAERPPAGPSLRIAATVLGLALTHLLLLVAGKPVAPVGLEAFIGGQGCEEACESQWWTIEPARYVSAEQCVKVVCTPIKRALPHLQDLSPPAGALPLLDDFLTNCGPMCDAEWWFDRLDFESPEQCRAAVCSGTSATAVFSAELEQPQQPQQPEQTEVEPDGASVTVSIALKSGNGSAQPHTLQPPLRLSDEDAPAVTAPPAVLPSVAVELSEPLDPPVVQLPPAAAPAAGGPDDLSRNVRRKRPSSVTVEQPSVSEQQDELPSPGQQPEEPVPSATEQADKEADQDFPEPQRVMVPLGGGVTLGGSTTSQCFRHSECPAFAFCAANHRCNTMSMCRHSNDKEVDNSTEPIDGLCPAGAPAPAGHDAAAATAAPAASVQIQVFTGHFVDQVRLVLSNATVLKFGADGGQRRPAFTVPAGEWVTWIKVYQGANLDGVQFFTNRGSSSPVYGSSVDGKKFVYHVDRGNEIFGLEFGPGELAPPIAGIIQRPRVPAPAVADLPGGVPYMMQTA